MSGLAPIVLITWTVFSISLFFVTSPRRAVIISVFGGVLLLPIYTMDFQGFPELDKNKIIAMGIFLGGLLAGSQKEIPLQLKKHDMPMVFWCFVIPMATALSNRLGVYYGLSAIAENFLGWGIFYWAGRKYFGTAASMRTLTRAFLFGGLIYIPLIFFEIRMSPRLHRMIYGFFAHEWRQHFRYGGYRPIVFMEHGLMVALFMAACTVIAFWLWRNKSLFQIGRIPMSLFTVTLIAAAILCRSANGWAFLTIGITLYFSYSRSSSPKIIKLLLLAVPIYIVLRITNTVSAELVQSIADVFFDDERVASLSLRLWQEDLFTVRALERPFFGWGGFGRAWPIDSATGEELIPMVDPLWVILLGWHGFFGLISVFMAVGIGPWGLLKSTRENDEFLIDTVVLCLITVFFMLDSLVNAMINPVFILTAGALLSRYLERRQASQVIGEKQNSA